MADLRIEDKQIEPGVEYVKFSGVLDASGQDAILNLEQKINKFGPKTKVIFDFTKLDYLNSYAIGFIAHWYNFLHKQEGDIILIKPQAQVYDTLNVLGMTNVLKIFESIEMALQDIKAAS